MELKGSVCAITGASSGIGAAVAHNLSEAGMRLVLAARREDRLKTLVAELGEAAYVVADMREPDAPKAVIDAALNAFGRCDVVFNNAGVMHVGTIEQIDVDVICDMVRVNVEGAYRMAYVALKHFRSVGSGYLINTSSILGTKVRPTAGAYAGTKFAIEALTEALRMEVAGSNVAVSCVEPGLVMTELHDHWEKHPREALGIDPPLEPEDVARCVRFILEQPPHVRIPKIMALPGAHAI